MPASTRKAFTPSKTRASRRTAADKSTTNPKGNPTRPTSASRRKPQTRATAPPHRYLAGNALVCGDNLDILKELPDECVDLIYLDPPFNSNHNYVAAFGDVGSVDAQLRDIWRWTVETENSHQLMPHGKLLNAINAVRLISGETSPMAAYAMFMGRRLAELHRVLKSTGSIYLHCDPHANHYLPVLLDSVFGEQRFRNEIIWAYRGGGVPKADFARKHDAIFRYSKTANVTFNVDDVRIPYSTDSEDRLLYKARSFRSNRTYDNYEPNPKGKHPEDWWEMQPIMPSSKERIGYPTQKPLS